MEHTQSWVDWIVHEFDLKPFDVSQFNLTGQQLCSLSKEEFLSRSLPYTGDVLFVHLLILRRGKQQNYVVLWVMGVREISKSGNAENCYLQLHVMSVVATC